MDAADTKGKNHSEKSADGIWVQIYEIQTPEEAEMVIGLGVDRMGSVVPSADSWKNDTLRETVRLRKNTGVLSSLIPLYSDPDMVYRTADYYEPDLIHFCEALVDEENGRWDKLSRTVGGCIDLQEGFRKRFPEIGIMRTIPVAVDGSDIHAPSHEAARLFEPTTDCFLIDTVLIPTQKNGLAAQPETGFVGITGKICDWEEAAEFVRKSPLPVILAGGLSPDNVYEGVLSVLPAGADSCTNTNSVDGGGNPVRFKKDPDKVKKFIEEVRRAEEDIHIKL